MKNIIQLKTEIIRQKAIASLKEILATKNSSLTETEIKELIHVLEVHKLELQMHDDELLQANRQLEETIKNYAESSQKYTELYDFAPSGYFTLSLEGDILELNFASAEMLGKEIHRLIKNRFASYISDDTKPIFNLFLEKIFVNKNNQSCEVTLLIGGNKPMHVQLIGAFLENEKCFINAVDITERKENETKYETIIKTSVDGFWISEVSGAKFIDVNDSFCKMIGYSREELLKMSIMDIEASETPEEVKKHIEKIQKEGYGICESKHRTKSGKIIDVEVSVSYLGIHDGKFYVFVRDITERKRMKNELLNLNRLHSLISKLNDLILRSSNKEKLFRDICDLVINNQNIRMAWVGMIDEETQTVKPAAWAGFEDGYLTKIKKISINDSPEGRGTGGRAIREGKAFVSNDIASDSIMEPWRKEALQRGYHSIISVPITVHNRIIGTFSLYAGEPNFFANEEEVALLEKITENISFALEKITVDEERRKAEQALRESEEKFKKAFAMNPDSISINRLEDGV